MQPELNGTAPALEAVVASAETRTLLSGSFLLMATDYLIPANFIADLLSFHASHNDNISISLKSVPEEELASRSSVRFTADNKISEVVEKPPVGYAPSKLSANLAFVLPPAILQYLGAVTASPRGERELQTAINAYLAENGTASGLEQPAPTEWSPGTT